MEEVAPPASARTRNKPAAWAAAGGADEAEAVKPRKSIQSVETGIRVIEALISTPSGRAPLRSIAAMAGMSRSQAHRYLLAYINTGLVAQEPGSGLYSLGPTALRIGLSAVARLDCVQQASNELRSLVEATGHTGLLSIWGDHGPTVVRWIDGDPPLVASLHVGSVLPLQKSSAGAVFLAFLPPSKVKLLLAKERSASDDISRAALSKLVAQTRKDGFATVDGRVAPGLSAITAPVFDLQGWPAATMGLLGKSHDPTFLGASNISAVRQAAERASVALGWRPEQGPAIADCTTADFITHAQAKPVRVLQQGP